MSFVAEADTIDEFRAEIVNYLGQRAEAAEKDAKGAITQRAQRELRVRANTFLEIREFVRELRIVAKMPETASAAP